MQVKIIPTLRDNYSFAIIQNNDAIVVDPGESEPILKKLKDIKISYIINTHHHADHVGGNIKIKQKTNAKIAGFYKDIANIPGVDIALKETFTFQKIKIDIIHLPGHTANHIALYIKEENMLFCGDILFSGGCGKVFNNEYKDMLNSLNFINKLPEKTQIFFGHEYTLQNLAFGISVEPYNTHIIEYKNKIINNTETTTIPTSLKLEKKINPFLRLDRLKKSFPAFNLLDIFIYLRKLKNKNI